MFKNPHRWGVVLTIGGHCRLLSFIREEWKVGPYAPDPTGGATPNDMTTMPDLRKDAKQTRCLCHHVFFKDVPLLTSIDCIAR